MGGGKIPKPQANPYEKVASDIAQFEYLGTAPQRYSFLQDYDQMRTPNFDISKDPRMKLLDESTDYTYAMGRPQIESQYKRATDNIRGSLPAGGALDRALAEAEMARAGQVSNLGFTTAQDRGRERVSTGNQIINEIIARAYGISTGASAQALQAIGNLAVARENTNAARYNARSKDWLDYLQQGIGIIGGGIDADEAGAAMIKGL